MGRIAIVGLRPKPGKAAELKALIRTHLPILRAEGLATEREPIVMEAQDGTVVEVFEWVSAEAIRDAHSNPAVQKTWQEYGAVCDYIPVGTLPEASQLFSEFEAL